MPQTAPIYASFRHDPHLPILVKFSGCGLSNALWGWTGLVRWHGSSRMQEFMGSTWFLHLKDRLDQHQPIVLCPRVRKRRAEFLPTAPLKSTTSIVGWIILQIHLISSMYDSSQSGLVLFFSSPPPPFPILLRHGVRRAPLFTRRMFADIFSSLYNLDQELQKVYGRSYQVSQAGRISHLYRR
jgi:hypothetical protein